MSEVRGDPDAKARQLCIRIRDLEKERDVYREAFAHAAKVIPNIQTSEQAPFIRGMEALNRSTDTEDE